MAEGGQSCPRIKLFTSGTWVLGYLSLKDVEDTSQLGDSPDNCAKFLQEPLHFPHPGML